MRKFSKKIAMMMVLAMLVSMFSGIVSASAASVWSAKSVDDDNYAVVMGETIEVKKGEFINFDLFKNIDGEDVEATEAGYEYTWESSDEEVIFIGNLPKKNGYARVNKEAEVGAEATITVNFKNLATGKDAERSFDVVVVEELAEEVEEVEYSITPNFGDEAFIVGTEYELKADITDAEGEAVEAKVVFSIDDKEVAKYTPAAAGEVTIVATVTIGEDVYEEEYTCDVVKAELLEVVQKDARTVEITFDVNISNAEAGKIELWQDTVNRSVYKKAAVAKDNVVTFTSYKDFTDKTEWTFKYGESEFDFTASLGAVDTVVVEGPSVVYLEPSKDTNEGSKNFALQIKYYDENGVEVKAPEKAWIEWKFDSKFVVISGDVKNGYKVTGIKADEVATISGIYHSNDFKATESGQYAEYKYEMAPVDIKVLKNDAANIVAITSTKVIDKNAKEPVNTLPANRYTYSLALTFMMDNGKEKKSADFTKLSYESTDETKLIVDPKTGALIPLVANTSVEVIVNNDKDMVGIATVVIGPNQVAVEPSSDTYKSVANGKVQNTAEFEFKGKDNFGADATYKVNSVKALSMPGTSDKDELAKVAKKVTGVGTAKLSLNAQGMVVGAYVFEAEVASTVKDDTQKWTKTFSVYVEDATGDLKSVALVADKTVYDTTITKDTKVSDITDSKISWKVIGYNDKGVAIEEIVSGASITVKLNDKEVENLNLYQAATGAAITVSGSAIEYKAIENGFYVISGTYGEGDNAITINPITVEVKGGQTAPAISCDATDVKVKKGAVVANLNTEIAKCFKAPDKTDDYEYINLTAGTVRTTADNTSEEGAYVAYVQNVKVTQKFTSGVAVTFSVETKQNITVTIEK